MSITNTQLLTLHFLRCFSNCSAAKLMTVPEGLFQMAGDNTIKVIFLESHSSKCPFLPALSQSMIENKYWETWGMLDGYPSCPFVWVWATKSYWRRRARGGHLQRSSLLLLQFKWGRETAFLEPRISIGIEGKKGKNVGMDLKFKHMDRERDFITLSSIFASRNKGNVLSIPEEKQLQ